MKRKVTQELKPRLRFPEFQDAQKWKESTLEEIADIKLGKMLDREKHTTGHLLPYLNNVSLRWNEVDTSNLPQMYFHDKDLDRFGLKAGDVVVCEGGEPGRSAVWDGRLPDLKFQKAIHRVRFNVPFDPRLLVLYLEAVAGTNEFEMLFTGGGIKHLTRETFARLKIPIMSLAEQEKIADCLTSLDGLLGAHGRKLDALKAHKKGLMQQLFPRQGETQPRLRFPEFRDAPEWDTNPLSQLCEIQTGKKDANEGAIDGLYPFFTCADRHTYSDSYSFDTEAILVAGNANVGQAKYYNGKFEAYQRTYVITDFTEIDVPYLFCFLDAKLRPALLNQVQTSAMSYIKMPMLLEFRVPAPTSNCEQQVIANCFSSIDDLISAQSRKLDALKTHKKGLMQQLFPSPEEVEA